jgi:hypothetical protein
MLKTQSQASQDIFVHAVMRKKTGVKTYLEVGAAMPTVINNTHMLESDGWRGLSIDIDANYGPQYVEERRNPFLAADACTVDWNPILNGHPFYGKTIDYLSFDVDNATPVAFPRFPFETTRFNVITIEHDAYRVGPEMRDMIRARLTSCGYQLVCGDVICEGFGEFEDWWVFPSNEVDMTLVETLRCNKTPSKQIVSTIVSSI